MSRARHWLRPQIVVLPVLLLVLSVAASARAQVSYAGTAQSTQDGAPEEDAWRLSWGAQAIGLWTEARPAPGRGAIREAYLTQPIVYGTAATGRFEGRVMLNFERWTLERGELNAGTAGEGYVDRRHPHTVLHELVVSARTAGTLSGSLTIGRGFAPFGTDDPMVRPFVKYPANHHHAQILERWIAVAALAGPYFVAEAGVFNGDEPTGPTSLGRLSRFGDSWSVRTTLLPLDGLELQASHAAVTSPEHAVGGGLDQRKWSASARFSGDVAGQPLTFLAEWASSSEHRRDTRLFTFRTVLAELAVPVGATTVAARFERTTRPEEERLADPFRSARPHSDGSIVGITRWRSGTLAVGHTIRRGSLRATPFAEVSRLRVRELTGSIFDPADFYGSNVHWSFSFGVRLGAGAEHGRLGRYGVALPPSSSTSAGHGHD